jgi:hypothetical protein
LTWSGTNKISRWWKYSLSWFGLWLCRCIHLSRFFSLYTDDLYISLDVILPQFKNTFLKDDLSFQISW